MKLRTAWHDAFGSQSLDFLCIDTEGFEVKVLDGFDWSMPPRIISVELTSSVEVAERGSVVEYLQSPRLRRVAAFVVNGFVGLAS